MTSELAKRHQRLKMNCFSLLRRAVFGLSKTAVLESRSQFGWTDNPEMMSSTADLVTDDIINGSDEFETSIPYWSISNADEISKWLFPSIFAIWNLIYVMINTHLASQY